MPESSDASTAQEDLDLLKSAAREAADVAMSHFGKNVAMWDKAPGHPVTEADLAVDASLAHALRSARPEYGWLSEETGEAPHARRRQRAFVVDPIDGTRAFIRGEPHWCIGLAVIEEGLTIAGVIYNPVTDELFEATHGGGAFRNGAAIGVSTRDTLQDCRMIASEYIIYRPGWATPWPEMEFADPKPNATLYRMALVASGEWDATLALWRKSDWDLAPGEILLREAGGMATTHDGEAFLFNRERPVQKSLLAAGPGLHGLLRERLAVVSLPDPHENIEEPSRVVAAKPAPAPKAKEKMTSESKPTKQLLHIVFGGELKNVSDIEFEDLSKVDFIGAFGSYKEAYDSWKSAAQRTVDHAETRYFILHAHRLLDPETGDHYKV